MIRSLVVALMLPLAMTAQLPVDGIAAIVGDKIILKSDVYQLAQMNALRGRVDLSARPELLSRYYETAFDALVMQNILLARAKVDSMDIIPDEEVDQALDQQIEMMLTQAGSQSRFEETIGQSLRDFRKEHWYNLRDQIIAERYQAEKISAVRISRDEVEEFYYAYKDSIPPVDTRSELSQIILPVRPGALAKELAYKEISNIQERLARGESFADLARQFSDDPASKERGGNLGLIRRGELVQDFEEVAFSLENGETSDVVETEFGYHIIQSIDKQGERVNVRHILITVEPNEADREATLERVRGYYFFLIENPALFDSLVNVLSNDNNPPHDLGYIGWIENNQLPQDAYRSAIFGTKPGDITPPFETQEGFHILKILDQKEGGNPTLGEYYPQIESLALRNKQARHLDKWLETIQKVVFIKKLD